MTLNHKDYLTDINCQIALFMFKPHRFFFMEAWS